jgi:hypothetical protein
MREVGGIGDPDRLFLENPVVKPKEEDIEEASFKVTIGSVEL